MMFNMLRRNNVIFCLAYNKMILLLVSMLDICSNSISFMFKLSKYIYTVLDSNTNNNNQVKQLRKATMSMLYICFN
jgi:hypothetical protein